MNNFLAIKRIDKFETILNALKTHGFVFRDMIDGGAGWGATSETIVQFGTKTSRCFAFEPFPGNHIFFNEKDTRIQLLKIALSSINKKDKFIVPNVVQAGSAWGDQGFIGYSSGGFLPKSKSRFLQRFELAWKVRSLLRREGYSGLSFDVECMRGDEVLQDANIDFIKLDLQGGELEALRGMKETLRKCPFMWIEFTGDKELLEYIYSHDFCVFDTSYLFVGHPSQEVEDLFYISNRNLTLSSGQSAYVGFKKCGWSDYITEFMKLNKRYSLSQTDLFCVKTEYIDLFYKSLLWS